MVLEGEAKKIYQRSYMRVRRRKLKLKSSFVRPNVRPDVRPATKTGIPLYIDADGNPVYDI